MTPSTKNETIITMIQCPACEVGWIDEAHEFVCNECVPKVHADLVVYEVHKAIQEIDKLDLEQIKAKLLYLKRAKEHLDAIIHIAEKVR